MRWSRLLTVTVFFLFLGFSAATTRGSEIKVGVFSTTNRKECFLTEPELKKLVSIMKRMRSEPGPVLSQTPPQELMFYVWEYGKADRNFKRHAIAFNAEGGSTHWKIGKRDAKSIVTLSQKLLKRAK
jgi:hypothetical protein